MAILLMLVPVSLLLLAGAIWAFVWAVRSGQFDDLDTPPLDILHEDDRAARQTDTRPGDVPPQAQGPAGQSAAGRDAPLPTPASARAATPAPNPPPPVDPADPRTDAN